MTTSHTPFCIAVLTIRLSAMTMYALSYDSITTNLYLAA